MAVAHGAIKPADALDGEPHFMRTGNVRSAVGPRVSSWRLEDAGAFSSNAPDQPPPSGARLKQRSLQRLGCSGRLRLAASAEFGRCAETHVQITDLGEPPEGCG